MHRLAETYKEKGGLISKGYDILHSSLKVLLAVSLILVFGCKTVQKKASEFVEELKNPTVFPEVFSPSVEDLNEVLKENILAEGDNVKIVPLGVHKNMNAYLIQIRENAEMDAHYHKLHDEVIYIVKGSGIIELHGARNNVKDGTLLIIPRKTVHRFINTGGETSVLVAFFSPPFDGEDMKVLEVSSKIKKKKRTVYDKAIDESKKEVESGGGNWLTFWKNDEKKVGPEEVLAGEEVEEQNMLIMTEEERHKVEEAQEKISEEKRKVIKNMILNEKLKVLQQLNDDGLLNQEEYDAKRAEIVSESE